MNRAAREASGLGVLFGQAVAAELGINPTDLECLDAIAAREDVSAGDLAAVTGLTTGAVTGVIDRLERAGFVRRERDKTDRRKVYVRLIPAAHRRADAHYRSFGNAVDRLTDQYSESEIALLVDYFTRARDTVLGELEKLKARTRRSPRRS